ncbi:MAG: alpha/beta fold hydrolase [Pseudomonadota bacterium]
MVKGLVGLTIAAFATYVGIAALLYVFQRDLQYLPGGSVAVSAALADRGVRLITIESGDGERLAALYGQASEGHPTILYLPGNGGSVADSSDRFAEMIDSGFGVLGLSYRGYPGSTGKPTEKGLIADGLAAYDWLIAEGVLERDLIIYGWSLGSGVAVQVAEKRGPRALILEAPFLSAEAIARQRYPIMPVGLLMKDTFRSDLYLAKLDVPLVVFHGTADGTIPVGQSKEVLALYSGPKSYVEIDGGSHVNLWEHIGWPGILNELRKLGAIP